MNELELLERLADAAGIGREYHDIWSRPRHTSPDTRRALLRAMGLRVDDREALAAELAAREERTWRRGLDPVQVVREPYDAIHVRVGIPADRLDEPHLAVLRPERGSERRQRFLPRELQATGSREIEGRRWLRGQLTLAADPGSGYHDLALLGPGGEERGRLRLIVAPRRCHEPAALAGGGRVWGPALQLYALRSARNWGVGDFRDLETLAVGVAEQGAGIIGLNPLHALFPQNPAHVSPYSPSSRLFVNTIYLDVETVPELAECEEARRRVARPRFQARLVTLREAALVDYAEVAGAKREILELCYAHFRREHLARDTPRARAFRAFVAERGATLEAYGIFEALAERHHDPAAGAWGWPVWPEPYRRPDTPEVARFAADHRERVEFHQYLQWLCDEQLARVGRRCLELGLGVGPYQDLAVSVDRAGFETWRWQEVYAVGASYGAPPDDFALQGQDWGLPPWIPERLREAAYEPFIEVLRANMRHTGALRIDHVMGLMRAFWVPPGESAAAGAYVHYPFEDLLGILALESRRNGCLVIGEDLGTVPDEVREALAPAGVLSYRLLFFMKDERGDFLAPEAYPAGALVAPTTHDLPTLAGYWSGRDIALRAELGLFPEERPREAQLLARTEDRAKLLFALRHAGLLPAGVEIDLAGFPAMTPDLVQAIHRFLARSPASVLTFQLEDVLELVEQVNLPGTTDAHPNWRRKLPTDLEQLLVDPRLTRLAEALRLERGSGRVEQGRLARRGGRVPPRAPLATYRLQLGSQVTFAAAAALVPYLRRLGVSHLYASPFLEARPGSSHGYDIIDHGAIHPEIGTLEELGRLVEVLRAHDMGLILDMVPNHMGVGSDNGWWMSVLEHGRASPWAEAFDIDWHPQKEQLRGRVLLPVLEDHFGAVLEAGLLRLAFDARDGTLALHYHDQRFPLDPTSYETLLGHGARRLAGRDGLDAQAVAEYESLVAAFGHLPHRDEADPGRLAARLRDAQVLERRLARLVAEHAALGSFVAENVALFNGTPGEPASFDPLETLLDRQVYRLAYWRVAADEINYRRFFDINDLAGLRMEHPPTFEATHRLVLDLLRRGWLDGLRIDHPDGLHDPYAYYARLREEIDGPTPGGAGAGPPDGSAARAWIVAEKILAPHERLPADWPIDGTTGYDFSNEVLGLLVDPAGERGLDRFYTRFAGQRIDYDETLRASKRLILDTALSSELAVLANDLERIAESSRHTRDFTLERLRQALADVIAVFPVYRTYVAEGRVSEEDRRHVEWAVARAKAAGRAIELGTFEFIRRVLLLESGHGRAGLRFAMKFQQTTAPVMAKGAEDTAFYIYNRLLALNEVGGDPHRFGLTPGGFHRACAARAASWPRTMLSTSTHDSKRSEDARARLALLSEIPERWRAAVRRFAALNRSKKTSVERRLAPSRNDEYAIYQTLVGVWPLEPPDAAGLADLRERVGAWALKAVREAKVRSSWIHPDEAYEAATTGFVDALLAAGVANTFLRELQPFVGEVARGGLVNSLAQLVLKLTAPGVPDLYQGTELWSFTLVDPDNRRPVDFAARERLLSEIEGPRAVEELAGLLRSAHDGRLKLWVTSRLLGLRREHAGAFFDSHEGLRGGGEHGERLCAFARGAGAGSLVVVVPRLAAPLAAAAADGWPLGAVWGDTWIELPESAARTYRDVLTGRAFDPPRRADHGARLALRDLLGTLPFAVLLGEE